MTYIKEIDFEISREYIEGVFESCRHVILPASGGFAMDMSCGFFDSKTCTAERWVCFDLNLVKIHMSHKKYFQYNFMGNISENDYTPFQINYKLESPERAFHAETKKCNESYPVCIMLLFEF